MREADVGSPSADTGRAISDHRISCPGLIWRRGSQSLMGNFGGSNRSSRWHWHQPRKGRCSDTGRTYLRDRARCDADEAPASPSSGNRRVLFDELALLQLRPELRRDPGLHGAVVSDDLLLAGGADNQGRGDIRRCGELQRRRPQIDAVPSRYLAQLFALFDDRLRDFVVFLAIIVPLTAADKAGVERRTHHE